MNETHDLALILESRIPIVVVDSADERRVLDLLTRFAISHQPPITSGPPLRD